MTVNERTIALAVLDHLRDDISTARTSDGHPITNHATLHQYLTEQINHVRSHEDFKVSSLVRGRPDGKAEVPEQARY